MVHIFSPKSLNKRLRFVSAPLLVLTLAMLHGCASVPPPDSQLNQAQSRVRAARDAGAADYAPVDLGFAQDKFQQAQTAMSARRYDVAAQLADEASADADVANTKARLGAARAKISAKSDENARLRSQLAEATAESQRQAQQSMTPAPSNVEESEVTLPAPTDSTGAPPAGEGTQPLNGNGGQP